jgi:hypothetical protein
MLVYLRWKMVRQFTKSHQKLMSLIRKNYWHKGVAVVGGCCGTTPEFIRRLRLLISQTERVYPEPKSGTFITSGLKTLEIGKGLSLIGERINPTGKPRLKEACIKEQYWLYHSGGSRPA